MVPFGRRNPRRQECLTLIGFPPQGGEPLSIRLRLTLVYGLLLALALVGFDVLVYWTLFGNLSREFDESLRLRATQVARSIPPGRDGRLDSDDVKPSTLEPASLEDSAEPG